MDILPGSGGALLDPLLQNTVRKHCEGQKSQRTGPHQKGSCADIDFSAAQGCLDEWASDAACRVVSRFTI
jgi:hypothetical protein